MRIYCSTIHCCFFLYLTCFWNLTGAQAGFYQTGSSLPAAPAAAQLHQTTPFGLQNFSSHAPVSYPAIYLQVSNCKKNSKWFLNVFYFAQFLSSNLQIAAAVQQQQQQQYRNSQPSYLKGGLGQQSQPPPPSSPSSQQADLLPSVFSSGKHFALVILGPCCSVICNPCVCVNRVPNPFP